MSIPKIIHQIWDKGEKEAPAFLLELSQTWKEHHPDWQYILWDTPQMETFINQHTAYRDLYKRYPLNIQRWDMIRYLILYTYGGVYVDFDYECIDSMEKLLENQSCCLALDPEEHARIFKKEQIITNAFMATEAKHPFFKMLLDYLLQDNLSQYDSSNQFNYVLETTGPYLLTRMYNQWVLQKEICLLSPSVISPLTKNEINRCLNGNMEEKTLSCKLQEAIAIHYFYGSWYER